LKGGYRFHLPFAANVRLQFFADVPLGRMLQNHGEHSELCLRRQGLFKNSPIDKLHLASAEDKALQGCNLSAA
jgi:hypothetical protein